jgi:CRISPR-associated endonuclease Csn1
VQEARSKGITREFDFAQAPLPAAGFREVVRATVEDIFVSRAERRRARGEAHAATIKRVEAVDGVETVFERKPVEKLKLADLDKIPVPAPYAKIADPAKLRDEMVEELRRWMEAGRPKDQPPRSPKGDVIAKVRVRVDDKVAVSVRGGTASRGEMARVDVFGKPNKRGKLEYYLVPIYPHQVADRERHPRPPIGYIVQGKPEKELDLAHTFLFSIYINSLIEVVKADGIIVRGYFKGLDRSTGNISIASPQNPRDLTRGIGAKTLERFNKLHIDRLGNVSRVSKEVRTWHGEACT